MVASALPRYAVLGQHGFRESHAVLRAGCGLRRHAVHAELWRLCLQKAHLKPGVMPAKRIELIIGLTIAEKDQWSVRSTQLTWRETLLLAVHLLREDCCGNTGCTQVITTTAHIHNSPESDSDNAHDGNDHRSRRSGRNQYLLASGVTLTITVV